jgi:soluble lytic murein transglycosylase
LAAKVKTTWVLVSAVTVLMTAEWPRAQEPAGQVSLVQTNHPIVSREISQLWLVPDSRSPKPPAALVEFASAVKLEVNGEFTKALAILSQPRVRQGPLGQYAELYKGVAELRLGRAADARRTFQALQARNVVGYLAEAAALAEAECDEALGDHHAAADIYERLLKGKTTTQPDDLLMRLGRASKAAGESEKASRAFARVYYDFPLGDYAGSAGAELDGGPFVAGSERFKRQLARAGSLFTARRYEQAREEFESLRSAAQGDDLELISLRIAECDYHLKRHQRARTELSPFVEQASRQGEALYFHAITSRALGDTDEYLNTVRRIVNDFGTQTWAEDALNDLASYYLIQDEDAKADEAFRELYDRFPTGRHAERAAWKIGWWAYRNDRFADTTRVFEKAAGDFPRSDYRPAWLYWAGRAHEALAEPAQAEARFRLTAADYLNTYYGRLAAKRLTDRGWRMPERILVFDLPAPSTTEGVARDASQGNAARHPPNSAVVRALLDVDLYDQALDELRYAQQTWGDSSAIQATMAWVYLQQGRSETGSRQLTVLRRAINTMKRAYPQYMAAGGEALPVEAQKVIFPMGYWDLIRKYAAQYELDQYLVAALIAQESTFVRDIRSSANAVGLTQLRPSTARQYARRMNVKYSTSLLTNPEANIRIGLFYLAEKVREFGEMHLAIASYNAGERPVRRWLTERPSLSREEFIDDIPFPETQNYVKKLLGTAEDYRRLYGSGSAVVANLSDPSAVIESGSAPTSRPKKAAAKSTKKKKTRKAA